MFDLTGKVVLVAGGAGYLALPTCKAMAAQGAKVIIADLKKVEARSLPKNISACHLDISDEASVRDLVATVVEKHGRLDVAINSTFFSTGKKLEDLSAEEFDKTNRINITGAFLFARECAQAMINGGSIIMYSSMYGIMSPNPKDYRAPINPNPIEYGTCKAAIIQMVKYMACHYGPKNIRVNAVAPGSFPWQSMQDDEPEWVERLAAKTMLGRFGKREEMVGAIVYLASDESAFMTGHVLRVDGGATAW